MTLCPYKPSNSPRRQSHGRSHTRALLRSSHRRFLHRSLTLAVFRYEESDLEDEEGEEESGSEEDEEDGEAEVAKDAEAGQ